MRPRPDGGYRVEARQGRSGRRRSITADRVVFAGGVMGTLSLLLAMEEDPDGLSRISDRLGHDVRTNSEALLGVGAPDAGAGISHGVAITSILQTDEHSHVEPVRYGAGSDFFRLITLPHAPAVTVFGRIAGALRALARQPRAWFRALTVRDFSRSSQILLYTRTIEGTMRVRLGRSPRSPLRRGIVT